MYSCDDQNAMHNKSDSLKNKGMPLTTVIIPWIVEEGSWKVHLKYILNFFRNECMSTMFALIAIRASEVLDKVCNATL